MPEQGAPSVGDRIGPFYNRKDELMRASAVGALHSALGCNRFGLELPCHIDAGPRRESSQHSGKSKWEHHLGRDLAEHQTNQSGLRLYFARDINLVVLPAMAGTAGRPAVIVIVARRAGWSRRRNPPSWRYETADHDPPYELKEKSLSPCPMPAMGQE